jgi:hypothetical protein
MNLWENEILYAKYGIISIWIIPLIMWLFNVCLLKSKHMRILQIFFAFLLFYISSIIIEDPKNLDYDFLIWLMGILPLFAWITWKCTTKKCLRHLEKVTKIRV